MQQTQVQKYINAVTQNMPLDWLELTTHRLDIFDESKAKVQFVDQFDNLYKQGDFTADGLGTALAALPTAFDYIRLGHPLSCVLEWGIAQMHDVVPTDVISFSSRMAPVLAILRKNLLAGLDTHIIHTDTLPEFFDADTLRNVYGYQFSVSSDRDTNADTTIYISEVEDVTQFDRSVDADCYVNMHRDLGSVVMVNGKSDYIGEIQHVRRRETIAMTPANTLIALKGIVGAVSDSNSKDNAAANKKRVATAINEVAGTDGKVILGSSGLSIQYAITMGLIDDALQNHKGKAIKIVIPPNCYGGTNDQARRVAACIDNVEIVDLPVDDGNDMVQSLDILLTDIAAADAIPYIIAEIPTNPRVEVPDLMGLKAVLSKARHTNNGNKTVDPVFILDQTFCPNVHFLGMGSILSEVRAIAYVSGSKFPSGGRCTAGYCVGNTMSASLIDKVEQHLAICDNQATPHQLEVLAEQMPSMNQRIDQAYQNTRAFVDFIQSTLPTAKINFVSHKLASEGFTPSVFSLDLPTKGNSEKEREDHKRELNLKLIHLMINEIPKGSKFCVSYGQLKGCYWTVPATSTQGTTKEGDKDYIVRVSVSPELDLERHKEVFKDFVGRYEVG